MEKSSVYSQDQLTTTYIIGNQTTIHHHKPINNTLLIAEGD
jgi:hypothetical protein